MMMARRPSTNIALEHASENSLFKFVSRAMMAVGTPLLMTWALWTSTTLWDMNTKNTVMAGDIKTLGVQMAGATVDGYKKADAERDFRLRDEVSRVIREQMEELRKRITEVERTMPKGK
jgi:hypothetical protein